MLGGGVWSAGVVCSGALLGPEETGPRWWGCFLGPAVAGSLVRPGWGGVLFFGLCIVDASIFIVFLCFGVLKLLRAHGGCLGIRVR